MSTTPLTTFMKFNDPDNPRTYGRPVPAPAPQTKPTVVVEVRAAPVVVVEVRVESKT